MVYLGTQPIAGFGTVQQLNYTDTPVSGQYVTSVSETAGIISVTRSTLSSSDTQAGVNTANGYTDEALTWGTI